MLPHLIQLAKRSTYWQYNITCQKTIYNKNSKLMFYFNAKFYYSKKPPDSWGELVQRKGTRCLEQMKVNQDNEMWISHSLLILVHTVIVLPFAISTNWGNKLEKITQFLGGNFIDNGGSSSKKRKSASLIIEYVRSHFSRTPKESSLEAIGVQQ